MSALKFEPKKPKLRTVEYCVNGCMTANGGRKTARTFCTIASWPVGYLCDKCCGVWSKAWAENSSMDRASSS
jgi:hypothetical protein